MNESQKLSRREILKGALGATAVGSVLVASGKYMMQDDAVTGNTERLARESLNKMESVEYDFEGQTYRLPASLRHMSAQDLVNPQKIAAAFGMDKRALATLASDEKTVLGYYQKGDAMIPLSIGALRNEQFMGGLVIMLGSEPGKVIAAGRER